MIRTYSHQDVLDLAEAASVPVINGLTDLLHPCQALGDIMSVIEKKGKEYRNIKMAFIGDGNNVCNSLINAAGIFGFNLSVASPGGYKPKKEILEPILQTLTLMMIICLIAKRLLGEKVIHAIQILTMMV